MCVVVGIYKRAFFLALLLLAALPVKVAQADDSPWSSYPTYYPGAGSGGGSEIISLDLDPKSTLNSSFRVAAREGRIADMQRFLKDGADINGRSDEGTTALMYGSRNCANKVVTFLLFSKADPNVRDAKGRTALMYAAMDSCPAAMKLLLGASGVNTKLKDVAGRNAEDYAMEDAVIEVGGPTSEMIRLLRSRHGKRAGL